MQTACSTSLVAVHLACQALLNGECRMALAGGVNIRVPQKQGYYRQEGDIFSSDGHVRSFDEQADGVLFGSGAGVVLLKPLDQAVADKDVIYAYIRGSAVNNDGSDKLSYTASSYRGQISCIEKALALAEIEPETLQYIEAHGTATRMGDPIEVSALAHVLGKKTQQKKFCGLGSVKSNVGHLDAASGITGLIKTVLMLHHGYIPPTINCKNPNPRLNLNNSPFYIVSTGTAWNNEHSPKRCAVNSLGIGGTNAFVILEEAPKAKKRNAKSALPKECIFVASAKSEKSLIEMIKSYCKYLSTTHDALGDICYTAATGRAHFNHRIALVVQSKEELLQQLSAIKIDYHKVAISDETFESHSLEELSTAYLKGRNCDWTRYFAPYAGGLQKVPLPVYCFDRQHYWIHEKRKVHTGNMDATFISNREKIPGYGILFNVGIDASIEPSLKDHVILSHTLFPGAGFVELLLEASQVLAGTYCIDELTVERALELKESKQLLLLLREENDQYTVTLSDEAERRYIQGSLSQAATECELVKIPELDKRVDAMEFYAQLHKAGLAYGPEFARILSIQKNEHSALAHIKSMGAHTCCVHPAELDCALQLTATLVPNDNSVYLPFQFKKILFNPEAGAVDKVYVQLLKQEGAELQVKVQLLDNINRVRLEIGVFIARKTDKQHLSALLAPKQEALFAIGEWQVIMPEIKEDQRTPVLFYDLADMKQIQQQLASDTPSRMVFVSKNHEPGALLGFVKSLIMEYPIAPIQLIDIGADDDLEFALKIVNEPLLSYKEGQVYAWRLKPYTPLPKLYQLAKKSNQIADLHLIEQECPVLGDKQIELALEATGLNFRDVLNAMDLYPGDPGPLGGEGAGIITRIGKEVTSCAVGDRVFGYIQGGFRSYAVTDEHLVAAIPQGLTTAQAAALPIVYTTVYHALEQLGKVGAKDKVLIHAAAGGVGMAAIALCHYLGAEVYATCSDKKRPFLEAMGVQHIYNSRNTDFSQAILKDTNNKGVDVVLNSLTSEGFIDASLGCLKNGGVFLEIGKRNIFTIEQMRPDIQYYIIALDTLASEHPQQVGAMLALIKQRIDGKQLPPLSIECFDIEHSREAFSKLQQAHNVGKLVVTQPAPLKKNAHILITGGLGALGTIVTHWLQEQGVEHLSIISRSRPEHPEPNIDYYQGDVANKSQVQKIIAKAHKKHPLTGIFHLAGVLDDGIFSEQTLERFEKVFNTKALGALNLHEATKEIPLDCFILFSSIASSMGSPGQTNYSAANSFLDQLAAHRHQQGLPALSIQWGPWLEAGMAANLVAEHARKGLKALKTTEGLFALNAALHSALPTIQIAHIDWNTIAKQNGLAPWMMLMGQGVASVEKGGLIHLIQQVEKSERQSLLVMELSRILEDT
ncbi:MAG: SDR family NAD(P)-dependent oxidoreductase, partial [Legionellales bacterium]